MNKIPAQKLNHLKTDLSFPGKFTTFDSNFKSKEYHPKIQNKKMF